MEIQDIVTLLITLATIITSVTTIYKCLTSFLRKVLDKQFNELQNRIEVLEKCSNETIETLNVSNELLDKLRQAHMENCRQTIKEIYYTHREDKTLFDWEKKSLIITYDLYHNVLGGNSYITELYGEMLTWSTK